MAAIPIALQGASMVMGGAQKDQATAAQIDQGRRRSIELVREMNYNDANLKLQSRDLLDNAVQDLTAANMDRVRNMGTIRAAIGEGNLEGNSMDRVERVTEGDYLREASGITESYHRDYSVILGNRYANVENTKNAIDNINKSEPKRSNILGKLIDPLGLGASFLFGVGDPTGLMGKLGGADKKIDKKLKDPK